MRNTLATAIRATVCAAVLVLLAPWVNATDSAQQALFREGVSAYRAQRYDDAESAFVRLLGAGQPQALLHNNLAVVLAAQGRYNEAVSEFQAALAVDGKIQQTFENLNGVYELMASEAYRQALGDGADAVATPAPLRLITQWPAVQAVPVPAVAAVEEPLPPLRDSQLKDELIISLQAWAEAWSSQNVDAYLGHYDNQFAPAGGISVAAWQQQRRVRLRAPQFIQVSTTNIQVVYVRNNVGSVLFDQTYRSNRFEDTIRKNLVFVRGPQGWRILQEQIVR